MSKRKPGLISALPPLFPTSITDASTGEILPEETLRELLNQLTGFVKNESQRLWGEHKSTLQQALTTITATSPAEVGRQAGLNVNLPRLPREVKAKSRIERLVRYQLITSAKSYYENPTLTKQEPTFTPYLNLGAVDAQMASITRENNELTLTMKLWNREVLLGFTLPDFVMTRKITKITLPVIKEIGTSWAFLFSVEEEKGNTLINETYVAGVDLGRVMPFTLTIIHAKTKKMVAHYTASKRLQHLVLKRNRLNEELGYLRAKSLAHTALGFTVEVLESERVLTRKKRNRLNREITWLIATEVDAHTAKYSPQYVAVEDLSWVSGTSTAKVGLSRWSHAKDQSAINHKLTRRGLLMRKVNPRNTSQECHKCSQKITQVQGKRLIVCSDCFMSMDRDVNAAINIALRPLVKRTMGSNCTATAEVTVVTKQPEQLHYQTG